jgi:hypothetical protein
VQDGFAGPESDIMHSDAGIADGAVEPPGSGVVDVDVQAASVSAPSNARLSPVRRWRRLRNGILRMCLALVAPDCGVDLNAGLPPNQTFVKGWSPGPLPPDR